MCSRSRKRKMAAASSGANVQAPRDLMHISLKDLEGRSRKMSEFSGKVQLFRYRLTVFASSEKSTIVAFPCRQFGNQEYADPKKVRDFADKHDSNFEIMEITNVNGPDTHPVFVYCKWNAPSIPIP
ncbi:hypothetical protein Efla_006502 [Eimeria flavescens]